jgi:hypothetical protein
MLIDYARNKYSPYTTKTYMTRQTLDLKARFRMALAATGMTQGQWAKEIGEVDPMHLSLVLNRKRESKKLCGKIEEFTVKTLKGVRAA